MRLYSERTKKQFQNNFFQYNNLIPLLALLFTVSLFIFGMKSDIEVLKSEISTINNQLAEIISKDDLIMRQRLIMADKIGINLPIK